VITRPGRSGLCLLAMLAAGWALAACGAGAHRRQSASRHTANTTLFTAAAVARTQGTLVPAPDTPPDIGAEIAASSSLPATYFSATSPWNTSVTDATVDPRSAAMLKLASQRAEVVDRVGGAGYHLQVRTIKNGLYINTYRWTTPVVSGGPPTKVWCRQDQCGVDAVGLTSLPIPADVNPEPSYDGWFTVVVASRGVAYDLWRARRQADGSISYQYIKRWALKGSGYQPPDNVSARGSGLPLFAGLITLQDLRSAAIDHALAISLPGPAKGVYVQPASATDGIGRASSVPEGARLRLSPGVSLGRLPAHDDRSVGELILRALQTYGAIVVDRSAVPTLYAQRDVTSSLIRGNELQNIHLSDFKVLTPGQTYTYPPPSTSAASVASGTDQTP
jgi:hypothetical protein